MGFGTGQIFTKQTGITVSGHVKSMPFAECREEGGGWHCETRVLATAAYTVLPYWALALTRHWKYPRGRGCFHLSAFCSGGKWLWSASSPENLAGSTLVYPLPRDPKAISGPWWVLFWVCMGSELSGDPFLAPSL